MTFWGDILATFYHLYARRSQKKYPKCPKTIQYIIPGFWKKCGKNTEKCGKMRKNAEKCGKMRKNADRNPPPDVCIKRVSLRATPRYAAGSPWTGETICKINPHYQRNFLLLTTLPRGRPRGFRPWGGDTLKHFVLNPGMCFATEALKGTVVKSHVRCQKQQWLCTWDIKTNGNPSLSLDQKLEEAYLRRVYQDIKISPNTGGRGLSTSPRGAKRTYCLSIKNYPTLVKAGPNGQKTLRPNWQPLATISDCWWWFLRKNKNMEQRQRLILRPG